MHDLDFYDLPEDLLGSMTCLERFKMTFANGYGKKIRIKKNFFANNSLLRRVTIRDSRNVDLDPEVFGQLQGLKVLDLADNSFSDDPLLRPQVSGPHLLPWHRCGSRFNF